MFVILIGKSMTERADACRSSRSCLGRISRDIFTPIDLSQKVYSDVLRFCENDLWMGEAGGPNLNL